MSLYKRNQSINSYNIFPKKSIKNLTEQFFLSKLYIISESGPVKGSSLCGVPEGSGYILLVCFFKADQSVKKYNAGSLLRRDK
jgi:hypothetical protein